MDTTEHHHDDDTSTDRGVHPVAVSATFACDGRISQARAATREFLANSTPMFPAAGPVSDTDAGIAQLVVSELVTNASKYAPGPSHLTITRTRDAVHLAVADTSAELPRPHGTDPWRAGQHGLELVVALCRTLDVRREATGKRVTAILGLADHRAA
ncbi:ATP-binding protein [Yinghuangia sp. YIM S09857]|uniref:ATP-binding protein n=1 Tax=Yinghuangia sp. YIM S09857 TaxID=3436929 RepID=UPI003F52B3CC